MTRQYLRFSQLNSWQRWVVHCLADKCGATHLSAGEGYERCLTLTKDSVEVMFNLCGHMTDEELCDILLTYVNIDTTSTFMAEAKAARSSSQ